MVFFFRQAKAKRVHHQTGFTRNVKGTSLCGKQKTITRNKKIMKEKKNVGKD